MQNALINNNNFFISPPLLHSASSVGLRFYINPIKINDTGGWDAR